MVEILIALRWLPNAFAVTSFACHHLFAFKAVRLIVFVARATQFILAEVGAQSLAIARFMAVFTLRCSVFAFERPARHVVVKLGFATWNILPAHQVIACTFVLQVT